ncbi:MAG: rod shape-determining protein MreD [Chthonomonas sp.]|nr:rod shape-determining protein MreD [Chthonomonas sp.]
MSGPLGIVVWMIGAAILQFGLAPSLNLWGIRPDFLLVFLGCFALRTRPSAGAGLGFFAGLVQGAMAGANTTHYILSRSITGFVVSLSRQSGLEFGPVLTALTVMATTIVARIAFMFGAAPPGIGEFLKDTISMAIYNGVLALPVYLVTRNVGKPKKV